MLPENKKVVHLNDTLSQPLRAGHSRLVCGGQPRGPQEGWD